MEYEPVCEHQNDKVRIEWVDIEELEGRRFTLLQENHYTLFVSDKVYIGKAHCDSCHSALNDHDQAAISAFDKFLGVKTKREIRRRKHAAQALVRN